MAYLAFFPAFFSDDILHAIFFYAEEISSLQWLKMHFYDIKPYEQKDRGVEMAANQLSHHRTL